MDKDKEGLRGGSGLLALALALANGKYRWVDSLIGLPGTAEDAAWWSRHLTIGGVASFILAGFGLWLIYGGFRTKIEDAWSRFNRLWIWVALIWLLSCLVSFFVGRGYVKQPGFHAKFLQTAIGEMHGDGVAIVVLAVANRGHSSTCSFWSMELETIDGKVTRGVSEVTPGTITLSSAGPNMSDTILNGLDSLVLRTFETPIPTGGQAIGILQFAFEGKTPESLRQVGNTLRVSCEDAFGHIHTFSDTITLDRQRREFVLPVPLFECEPVQVMP